MNNLPYTVFVDIDGTILAFEKEIPILVQDVWEDTKTLKNVPQKLAEWHQKGYKIFLVTGRPESLRQITESQLQRGGCIYDHLIMGCGSGVRFLINDVESFNELKAVAVNIERDFGIGELDLEGQYKRAHNKSD